MRTTSRVGDAFLSLPRWTGAALAVALLLGSGTAAAASPFCPPAGTPTVCAGRAVGDVLVTLRNRQAIIGLNPGSGQFYVFTAGSPTFDVADGELGDIAVEPANPLHTLLIGDVNGGGLGVLELDDCGAAVNRAPEWGQYQNVVFPHHTLTPSGFTPRDLVFSPTTGRLWTLDDTNDGGDIPPGFSSPTHVLFSFPATGGLSTATFATGDVPASAQLGVAADELGNLYSGTTPIVKYTAAGLASGSPVSAALPGTVGAGFSAFNLVADGKGSLFATVRPETSTGAVWKVDTTTGTSTVWTSNFPASLGGGPLDSAAGIAIDANGDLWVVQDGKPDPSFFGVAKISGTTGQVLQFFPFPLETPGVPGFALVGGLAFGVDAEAWGLAILGVNLPAVREDCATVPAVPTVLRAIDATTGGANLNPPARTDSFLSCQGPYGGSNVRAHGDVQAGTSINVNTGAVVSGARLPSSPVAATPMAVPPGLVSSGSLNVNGPVTLAAGDYLYDNININTNGTLTGGGLVRIWYRFSLNINSVVNAAGGLPGNLWFFGLAGSSPVGVNSGARVTGVIDAPTTAVTVNASSTLFGAAVGSTVTMNGGQVHYDEVLGGATCP